MADCRSATLANEPRRTAFAVSSPNPTFHQVEPTGTGRDKVRNKPRMALQPRLHVGMLVGAVIVHHQVESDLAGKLRINASQEFPELLMAVPGKALTDHFPLQDLQGREQARCAIALVVARKLEALDAVRLQVVAAPDIADRGFAHALRLGHLPTTPLRHPSRLAQQRRLDNRLDLTHRVAGLASTKEGQLHIPDMPQHKGYWTITPAICWTLY